MIKRFFGASMLVGALVALGVLPALAQPVEFEVINIKKAQLVFLRNAVLVDISGCFVLGEGSDGIDPTTGENPALHFSLGVGTQIISKNIQTASFKVITDGDNNVVGYTTGLTFGSGEDTPGGVRVRLREVRKEQGIPNSQDPCKRVGTFWRFEIRGSVSQASRQFRQTFQLTIGDDTSGAIEVQVAVRLRRAARGTSVVPRPVQALEVFDLQGRRVPLAPSPGELGYRRSLPPGVYLVVLTELSPDGQLHRRVQKIVIRR
jgi:hypothetical protein